MEKLKRIYLKNREIINYLIVGGLTSLISLIVYYGLVLTILDPKKALELQMANIVSWVVAITFAYITNRLFVFKSKSKNKLKEASSFVGARIITLLLDMGIMYLFVTVLGYNDKIFKLITQVIVIVLNYLFSKLFVFKKD